VHVGNFHTFLEVWCKGWKLFIFHENIKQEIEKLSVAKRGERENKCVLEFHYTIDAWKKRQLKVPLLNNKFVLELLTTILPFGQKSWNHLLWEIICQNQIWWCTILFHANNACPSMWQLRTLRHMAMSMKSSQVVYYPCCPEEVKFNCWNCFSMNARGKELEHHALAPKIPAGRPFRKKE
jgi:hypothetical protein